MFQMEKLYAYGYQVLASGYVIFNVKIHVGNSNNGYIGEHFF